MIERYAQPEITEIWSDENKTKLWQRVELAVIKAEEELGKIEHGIYSQISSILKEITINLVWWKNREKEIHHDLQAFVEERRRHLPDKLKTYFHRNMTSYDTEEPAFASQLKSSVQTVREEGEQFKELLEEMAKRYRFTPMMARTHGQEAKIQSFGKRCFNWGADLQIDLENLEKATENLRYSKLSGAVGNYEGLDLETEELALEYLGLKPFYGASQIIPREIYAPLAQALCQIVLTLQKIALTIRLGARSGIPIYQEPFSKRQKGSSAMPHKKNTVSSEQIEGMARLAKNNFMAILENISTWEERAIEQSCVERIAWPDLFQITLHSLRVMKKVLSGLQVYPINMVREIVQSRGCYASSDAKDFLASCGFSPEDAYHIVQLAAFNVFGKVSISPPDSSEEAEEYFASAVLSPVATSYISIEDVIVSGNLKHSADLEIAKETVEKWNGRLKEIFIDQENLKSWNELFSVKFQLRGEKKLFWKILAV